MKLNTKTILGVIAAVVLTVALTVGCVLAMNAGDRADARADARALHAANHACDPRKPVDMDYHGTGWSHGPFWKVTCPDRTVRVIAVNGE